MVCHETQVRSDRMSRDGSVVVGLLLTSCAQNVSPGIIRCSVFAAELAGLCLLTSDKLEGLGNKLLGILFGHCGKCRKIVS